MAGVQEIGNDVLAEVVFRLGIGLVGLQEGLEHAPLEDVDAHGGLVALGMLGLFLELEDGAVLVGVHDAEAAGLLHGNRADGDGAVGLALLVEAEHLGVIHLIDMVAREDQHLIGVIAVDEADILINGVGRALIPLRALGTGIGRQNAHAAVGVVEIPGLAVADVLIEFQGLVLGEDAHGVDVGIHAVGKGKVDDAVLTAKGNGRFGGVLRQDLEPAALAAGQEHRDTALFLKIHKQVPP